MFFHKSDYNNYTSKRFIVILVIFIILTSISILFILFASSISGTATILPILSCAIFLFIILHCLYFPKGFLRKFILTVAFLLIVLLIFCYPMFYSRTLIYTIDTTKIAITYLPETNGLFMNIIYPESNGMGYRKESGLFLFDKDQFVITNETFEKEPIERKMKEGLYPPRECSNRFLKAINPEGTKCIYIKEYAFFPVGDAWLFGWVDYHLWSENEDKLIFRSFTGPHAFYWSHARKLYLIDWSKNKADIYKIKN